MISTIRRLLGRHLWVVGLAAWITVTWVVASLLPPQPGPDSERPGAQALLVGGIVGFLFIAASLIRRPRNMALWGLTSWSLILILSTWDGVAHTRDGDIDQTVGYGFVFGALVGMPLIGLALGAWLAPRVVAAIRGRPRRWNVSVQGNNLVVKRKQEADPREGSEAS
jgi:hypothetical protein